jgi:hypothetical protein
LTYFIASPTFNLSNFIPVAFQKSALDIFIQGRRRIMPSERIYQGESTDGKLQEALDRALQQLDGALGEGGVSDATASWKLFEVTGQRGGIAGFRSVQVKIATTRTPAWS